MKDRPLIQQLHAEGATIKGIARDQDASRNAVRRALRPGARISYSRRAPLSEEAEEAVREVLASYPHMVAADISTVIAWRHSPRALAYLVARLRPEYANNPSFAGRPIASIKVGTLTVGTLGHAGTMKVGPVQAPALSDLDIGTLAPEGQDPAF